MNLKWIVCSWRRCCVRALVLFFVCMEVGSIVHEKKKTRQKTRIKKTEREMQVSATSRHCEKNG